MIPLSCRVALCVAASLLFGCSQRGAIASVEQSTGGSFRNGRHLVFAYGCGSCHVIPGIADANGHVGPSLEGFASRLYIAGSLTNETDNVVAWITGPQKIVPGNAMPDLGVTPGQAREMATFLYTLR